VDDVMRLVLVVTKEAYDSAREDLKRVARKTKTLNLLKRGVRRLLARQIPSGAMLPPSAAVQVTQLPPPPAPPERPPVPPPVASTVTLQCPADDRIFIPFQSDITLSGSLTPALSGSTVELAWDRPTKPDFVTTAQADATGAYTASVPSDDHGYWYVKARFAGDATRLASESNTCLAKAVYP
jgi:hypothetical protein